jgi:hypothetical protein
MANRGCKLENIRGKTEEGGPTYRMYNPAEVEGTEMPKQAHP